MYINDDVWISKHRLMELKHFCLQYPDWKKKLRILVNGVEVDRLDPTGELATAITSYQKNINLVEQVCKETDRKRNRDILKAVTRGLKFETLEIPLDRYYTFYSLLNSKKGI